MAHSLQDYSAYLKYASLNSLTDLGELAARMNSIVVFDGRGDVVRAEDFEGLLNKFGTELFGLSTSVSQSDDTALSGSHSIKLDASSTVGNSAALKIYSAFTGSYRIGTKISVTISSYDTYFDIFSDFFDGVYHHKSAIRYSIWDKEFYYLDSSDAFTKFATGQSFYLNDKCFHHLKLVIDTSAGKYVRFLFDNLSWDLSNYSYYKSASGTLTSQVTTIRLTNQTAFGSYAYIDDYVLTVNEP